MSESERAIEAAEELTNSIERLRGELQRVNESSEARDRDLAEAQEALSNQAKELADQGDKLVRYGHRNRILIAVVLLLAVVTAFSFYRTDQADTRAEIANARTEINSIKIKAIHASNLAACRSGNEFRAEQEGIWNKLLQLSTPAPHQSQAQRKQGAKKLNEFFSYLHHVLVPRDCVKVYRITARETTGTPPGRRQ